MTMHQPRVRALTFDVFGTLLAFEPGCNWAQRYGQAVRQVREGQQPYRDLTSIFAEIGADWRTLTPRPGVVEALARLKAEYTIAPLSNADSGMSRLIADHFGLPWNLVIDTEAAEAFKPDPRVYRLGLHRLGLPAGQVMHVAAHEFDLDAALRVGLRTAYVAWDGYSFPAAEEQYNYQIGTLAELAEALTGPNG